MNRRETLQLIGSGLSALALQSSCQSNDSSKASKTDTSSDEWDGFQSETGIDSGYGSDTATPNEEEVFLADEGPILDPRPPRSLLKAGESDLDLDLFVISGVYPEDINGHVFVVHPILQHHGPPIVAGEGAILRLDLNSQPQLSRRLLKPPCYYLDQATQGSDVQFEYSDLTRVSFTLGLRALLNTGLVAMNNRLLVTTDAGRPWMVDPTSLELLTPVGQIENWNTGLPSWITDFMNWPFPLHFSTAHPVFDKNTETFFSVNWGMQILNMGGFVNLIRWDGHGEIQHFRLVNAWGIPIAITQSVHQIAVTSNHICIMDTAFVSEMEDLLGNNNSALQTQAPESIIYIVNRESLLHEGDVIAQRVSFPRETAHFLCDYNTSNGRIVMHVGHQCASDPSEFINGSDFNAANGLMAPTELHGMLVASTDIGQLGRYEIHADSGEILSRLWKPDDRLWGGPSLYTFHERNQQRHDTIWWLSFGLSPELRASRVESAYEDYPYREVPIAMLPTEAKPSHIIRLDCNTLDIQDAYMFPQGRWASSPTFVPRNNAEVNDGYIIATVISDDESTENSSGDEFWIFDAQNLAQGPICRISHPSLRFPLTLHTCFMDTVRPNTHEYCINIKDELESRIQHLSPEVQDLFETEVFIHF